MPKEAKIMDIPGVDACIWYSVDKGYLLRGKDVSLSLLIGWVLKNFSNGDIESQINECVRQNAPREDMCFIASYPAPSGDSPDNL